MKPIVHMENIEFTWPGESRAVLDIPSLIVEEGESFLLRGRSGSGKTTLLNLLAGINVAEKGLVRVLDQDLSRLSMKERDRFRGDRIGFIFQQFNLLPYLSVEDNVLAPLLFSPRKAEKEGDDPSIRAGELLTHMELSEYRHKQVTSLSIGQQQRAAAARALIGAPDLIIADEPTSALDGESGKAFMDLLFFEAKRIGSTLVVVSHDPSLEPYFDRCVHLESINRAGGAHRV